MMRRSLVFVSWLCAAAVAAAQAPAPNIPPGEKEPLLRLEAGGPTSFVTALAFSGDGKTLYAAGFDKVVRVWNLDEATGRFVLDRAAFRVPIGPGSFGAVNALTLSPDGAWLAVGGREVIREGAGFRQPGLVLPSSTAFTDEMREDEGTIYLFDTRTREVRLLRGHRGPVIGLAFAPWQEGKPALLASAAREWDSRTRENVGVVRLWDVDRGEQVERTAESLPDPQNLRPGLAVRQTGREAKQVQVAIAWPDSQFRTWDVANGQLNQAKTGRNSRTVAFLPDADRALAGVTGKLQVWNVTPGGPPQVDPRREVTLPNGNIAYAPWAMALVSSQANGRPDYAAAVLVRERGEKYQLFLGPLDRPAGGSLVPLWAGDGILPAVAASPRGRHLAVAGNRENEIAVFSVADLVNRRPRPQILRSSGSTMRSVEFARKGKDVGLLLREAPQAGLLADSPQAATLLFDVAQRRLSTNVQGWQPAAPDAAGWEARASTRAAGEGERPRAVVSVSHNGQLVKAVELSKNQVLTSFVVLPPGLLQVPILAVAFDDLGDSLIYLFNAQTGEKVRQLSGHTNRVHALAFSPDGKLLASAAADQTVCVWSLTTLDKLVGQQGMLQGVVLKQEKDGPLVVSHLDDAALAGANRGKLKEGDVVEGLVEGDKLRPAKGRIEFYDFLRLTNPGKTTTVRVRDANGQRRDVALVLGQAIDERKPLFSFFVSRGAKAQERAWLGWSPLGFYDASDEKAERNLGLHFNTGNPKEPTRFAFTDQYRQDHYREGILKFLVARGSLSPALEDWKKEHERKPLPKPNMTLWIDEIGPEPKAVDGEGRALVQQTDLTLKFALDNFPPDGVQALTWQFDDAAPRPLTAAVDKEWSADLSKQDWKRGTHKVAVTLRTQEAEPKTYTAELALRYQPRPPRVSTDLKPRISVDKPEFALNAVVRPGAPGQAVDVRVAQQHKNRDVLAKKLDLAGDAPLTVNQPVKLEPGDNLLEIVAVNRGALRGYENAETDRMAVVVTYTPPRVVAAPRISLDRVVFRPEGAAVDESRDLQPGQPVIVPTPRVRILGSVRASEDDTLVKAAYRRGEAAAEKAVARFEPKKSKDVPVDETLELTPGSQQVHFVAKSGASPEADVVVTVEYRPPLPTAVITAPESGKILYEGTDQTTVLVKARLTFPQDRQPFQAVVHVNGQDLPAVVDEKASLLTAKAALHPGDNRIQVRLRNEWQVASASEAIDVRYLRPPRITRVEGPRETQRPEVDIAALIDSALPPVRESLEIEVNGRKRSVPAEFVAEGDAAKTRTWKVRLPKVPLDEGKNEVALWISNPESRSLQPGTLDLTYKPKQPPSPPTVKFLSPSEEGTSVNRPQTTVHFQVRTKRPLKEVSLVREPGTPFRKAYAPAELRAKTEGVFDIEEKVDLVVGENRLRVEAVNDEGDRGEANVVIAYMHVPVRLAIDQIELMGEDRKAIKPELHRDGKVTFPEVPHGRIYLQGSVTWDQEDDDKLKAVTSVEVNVNDIRQLPAELKPAAEGRKRTFRAAVFLNQATGNNIEVRLPGLVADANNLASFGLNCAEPEKGQRLHLLVVGVGARDEKKLTEGIFEALGAKQTAQGQLTTPAFQKVLVYGPLTGYVNRGHIFTQLYKIKHTIRTLKEADLRSANRAFTDVVMMYYQGTDSVDSQRYSLLTSESLDDPKAERSAIGFTDLTQRLSETPGAQMLLLDVVRAAPRPGTTAQASAKAEQLPDDLRVGIMRAAWHARTDAPSDARLLTSLQDAMVQASRVKDVAKYIGDKFTEVEQRYPKSLDYESSFRPGLAQLAVGQAAGSR